MSLTGLSLRDLEYLVAVTECRHFGRAARRCGVSQPSLSAQVRKLEALLGVTVFERGAGRVSITCRGEAILAKAEAVLREAQGLLDLAHGDPDEMAGPFRLAAIPTLGPYLLPFAMQPIREAFPALRLSVCEGRTDELMGELRAGTVDAVLACPPEDHAGLVIHQLFVEPFLLMHRPGRIPAWPVIDRSDPMVLLDEGHCLRDQALQACQPHPRLAAQYASGIEMLRYLVAAGEGISLLPALAAQAIGTLHGQVVFTPVPDPEVGREVVLVARRSDPRIGRMPILADLIQRAQQQIAA